MKRMPETKDIDAQSNLDYDARRINWPRLWERVIASVINATFYGGLLVMAKALGLL